MLLSKNDKLFELDDGLLILDYITTISEGIFEQKKLDEPRYLHYSDPEYHKLIVFDRNKQTSADLPTPGNGTITTHLPGNRLLVKTENKDTEENFTKYNIYKLMEN